MRRRECTANYHRNEQTQQYYYFIFCPFPSSLPASPAPSIFLSFHPRDCPGAGEGAGAPGEAAASPLCGSTRPGTAGWGRCLCAGRAPASACVCARAWESTLFLSTRCTCAGVGVCKHICACAAEWVGPCGGLCCLSRSVCLCGSAPLVIALPP